MNSEFNLTIKILSFIKSWGSTELSLYIIIDKIKNLIILY